MTIMPFKVI